MAIDYASSLATATRLISENGRPITLVKQSETAADPARPWGPKETTGGDSVATIGVFLDLNRFDLTDVTTGAGLGSTNVEARQQRILVPAAAALPEEMGPEWQVQDGSLVWEVQVSRPLKPGGTLILYELVVSL